MADYTEWLESTIGTNVIEDNNNNEDSFRQFTVQDEERDAVLCLIDCQHSMFQKKKNVKEELNTNNLTELHDNIFIQNKDSDVSSLYPKIDSDIVIETGTVESGLKLDKNRLKEKKNNNNSSSFRDAVRCVLKLYKDKVITSDKDLVALVLYNSKIGQNIYNFPGVYVFHSFNLINFQNIQEIEELSRAGEEISYSSAYEEFKLKIGHTNSGECHLSDALWASQHMFLTLPSDIIKYRRIFLFTNDSQPHKGKILELERCLARVRDLHESGVTLEVFAMNNILNTNITKTNDLNSSYESNNNNSNFWELIHHAAHKTIGIDENNYNSDTSICVESGFQDFNHLFNVVRKRTHPHRPFQNTLLTIGLNNKDNSPVPKMAVSLYYPLMPALPPQKIEWINKSNNEIVKKQTNLVENSMNLYDENKEEKENEEKQEELNKEIIENPDNFSQFTIVGGRQIFFTANEKKKIIETATAGAPVGFSIICFKHSEDIIKHEYIIDKSSFLHPNLHDGGKGSLRLFIQLTRTLLQQNKVAIAQCILRRGAPPRLVALVPSIISNNSLHNSEKYNKFPVEGLGLYVISLPYADDIRSLPSLSCFNNYREPSMQDIELAKRIVSSLSVSYDINAVPNPSLQFRYQILQKLAKHYATTKEKLDISTIALENFEDLTLPDLEGMSYYSNLFKEFNTTVLGTSYNADKLCPQPKSIGITPVKTHRTGNLEEDINNIKKNNAIIITTVESAFHRNALSTLTVTQMKTYLTAVGGNLCGARRKEDIIQVLTKVLNKQMNKY